MRPPHVLNQDERPNVGNPGILLPIERAYDNLETLETRGTVLFDMNGTLIDNVLLHQAVWRKFTARHGLQLADEELNSLKKAG